MFIDSQMMTPSVRFLKILIFLFLISCNAKMIGQGISSTEIFQSNTKFISAIANDSIINDTTFVNLKDFSQDFVYDMKYATTDNFLKSQVYNCAQCYLRFKTVKALLLANKKLMKKGYRIKIFDCYRPLDIQKRMWELVPNPEYVANPSKGSIHNRGGAVDITLVDKDGLELDMGTPFDHFGVESSHDYSDLSDEVIDNRKLLKRIMLKKNFEAFDSEWWHYNLKKAKRDTISNFKWQCD